MSKSYLFASPQLALVGDEGYGKSCLSQEKDRVQKSANDTITEMERGDIGGYDSLQENTDTDEDSNYSFVSREAIETVPMSNLKRWKNVDRYQSDTTPRDTNQLSVNYTNSNPVKIWRQNHIKQLEKRFDLVLIEEEEGTYTSRSLAKERPSNSSIDKISSSESLFTSSSGLGDIMEEDEEDALVVRESVNSDITFGRSSDTNSIKQEATEPPKPQKSSFIRGLLSRTKDPIKSSFESKIPKYHHKQTLQKQEDLSEVTKFKVLGGRSVSADGKPKTPLLTRLYNIGKTIHKEIQPSAEELEDFIDWKKIDLFDDVKDDEFDLDAIREMKRFMKKYKIIKQIGTGGHSTVRLASRKADSAHVVAKFIHSSNVWHWNRDLDNLKTPLEISMMKIFHNIKLQNVIRYIEHYQIGERFIIIMEYLGEDWIDLYDFIELHGPVEEPVATHIFKSVCETIQTMHSLGYSHNDIKDENVMINKKDLSIKLIDFGSTVPLTTIPTTTFYGTQKFSSPEALCNQSYVLAEQEVWAIGTLLYVLLFKMDPFANDEEILDLDISIRIDALRTRSYGKNNPPIQMSDDAAESIIMMLSKNPEERPKIEHLLDLPIFRN